MNNSARNEGALGNGVTMNEFIFSAPMLRNNRNLILLMFLY